MNATNTTEQALNKTAENVSALAAKIDDTVKRAQTRLNELQTTVVDKTKYAAQNTDAYVHENPWTAIGAAISVGFVLGLILGRR